ncbi:hypothetical protein SLA2020_266360 [Shorea laevis]
MGAEELVNGTVGFHEMEEDENFSDSELVYHVRDALSSVSSGDSDSYNQLVGVMHHSDRLAPEEVALLVTSLKALSGAVSHIDIVLHDSLLSSVNFRMNMWNYGPDVMDALLELIISLAASNGKHVNSCLEMLVSNFTPPYYFVDILKQPRGLARKDQVLSRVHSAFKHIADLVPLAPTILSPIVSQRMPIYAKEPLAVIYVENMLKLESGAIGEFVQSTMLMGLMDMLLELDVEIGWDDILQDDSSKGIFQMELENVDEISDYDGEDGTELPRELSRKSLGGSLIAEKLDSLMVLTFEHLESCKDSGRLVEVFEHLLGSFRITVLTAYKSKFAQFVMFYACALDPETCGVKFAELLADIFVCNDYPLPFRMSAVAYLASYLSRANFLSAPLVARMLKRLVDWSLEYCKTKGGEMNPTFHRLFYSACQAIMYVLCFRMKSMMDVAWFKSHLLLIEPILNHKLSPLKVCLPSIIDEFCRQAEAACLFTSSEEFVLTTHWMTDTSGHTSCIGQWNSMAYWIQNGLEGPRGMPARIRPSTSPESL